MAADLLEPIGTIRDILTNRTGTELPSDLPKDFTLLQSEYDFTYRVFPEDIGQQSDQAHYMIININVPNRSTYSTLNDTRLFTPMKNELSKTDALRFNIDKQYYDNTGTSSQANANKIARPRFTRRIKESIALWIPETMQFSQEHVYADVSLTSITSAAAQTLIKTTASFIGGFVSPLFPSLANGINAVGEAGSSIIDSAATPGGVINKTAQLLGAPINPKVEILFENSPQRGFDFTFLFAPESQNESDAMYEIIKSLRFHAAPEIDAKTLGFTYTPPSEFDITFFYKGKENLAIPRINTCVLENIAVDYAPHSASRWVTFSNGHPVMCRMTLKFRETEVLSKLRVSQGF